MSLPKIYVYSTSSNGGSGMCHALASDGSVLGSHFCSNEQYALNDLGVNEGARPDRHETYAQHFPDGYEMEFIPARELDSHEGFKHAYNNNQLASELARQQEESEAAVHPNQVTFRGNFNCIDTLLCIENLLPSEEAFGHLIAKEPMIHSASLDFAVAEGGPITRAVLNAIRGQEVWAEELAEHEARGYCPVIDTKSVLLMEGQYAAIPGWHADGVPRGENGQPILDQVNEPVLHYTYVVNDAGVAGTEFVSQDLTAIVDPDSVWSSVNRAVEDQQPSKLSASNGSLIKFSRATLHRVGPAVTRQWRYFFRLSFYHKEPLNLIRHQVNVYTDINQGW